MPKPKFDGVVEAVRYTPDKSVAWVRIYLRHGAAFSDYVLMDRSTLVEHLKSGKRYVAGKRIPRMAGTFEVSAPLQLLQSNGREILATSATKADAEYLAGVPII